jgi:hypothetical protein
MVCGSVRPARRARRSSSSELRIAGVDGVMEASERGFVAWCLVALPPGSYSTPHQKSRELSRAGLMPKEIAGPARRHPQDAPRRSAACARDGRPGVARSHECREGATGSCRTDPETRNFRKRVSARCAAQTRFAREARTHHGHELAGSQQAVGGCVALTKPAGHAQ